MARQQQFKILIAVIIFGILAGASIITAFYWEKVLKPERMAVKELKRTSAALEVEAPDPGRKEFESAIELIRAGNLAAAQERLAYLMRFYPDSSKYAEARRIAGEINLDLLLSDSPAPFKVEYTVQSGDALSKIASRYQCTLDFIMRANGRTGTVIHIGDKLWVAPLVFVLEADLSARRLTVHRLSKDEASGGTLESFFKDYPILDANLPPTIRLPSSYEIEDKPAWLGTRRARFTDPRYHLAHRWLQTGKPGLVIQAIPENLEEASFEKKTGILLDPGDMKELYTYIRTGTTLRLTGS